MADIRVLQTQRWLNETYSGNPGYNIVEENGKTGFQTVHALIRAVQIELGIYPTFDNFGPETMRRFPNLRKQEEGSQPTNLNYILQGAFWCKGYSPGSFTGNFYEGTERAVMEFQGDVGFTNPDGIVDGKLMKVILNTDGFRLSSPYGRPAIRKVQQILNREYSNYFDYIPTNGIYERKTNTALIYALQHEEGIGHIANGNFGPSTIANCPTLSPDYAPRAFVKVLQYALVCNGPEYDTSLYDEFGGYYTPEVEGAVRNFQGFMTLPETGIADMPTIKQLLTSNGYTGRTAMACDASTIIDEDTVKVLKANGYGIIGRYLTGTVGGIRSKAMTRRELSILTENGIRVFPIYQDGGWYVEYFVPGRGTIDAYKAINAAYELGFQEGTTIYFAVDFDAYDYQVDGLIIPYMWEIREVFDKLGKEIPLPEYKLGVYGARNTCLKCLQDSKVRTDYSFVANMSTGFSGNLGFPMPYNWSFGQFFETDIESVVNNEFVSLRIDKNDYSGRDSGSLYLSPPSRKLPEYYALFDKWVEIGQQIPFLKDKPNLFTTSFVFNQPYALLRGYYVDVDVTTSTEYSNTGEVDGVAFTVQDGKVSASLTEMLGEMFGRISSDKLSDIEEIVNNFSLSIGNGFISMNVNTSNPNEVKIDVTAHKQNIPVEGGNEVHLSVTVTFTFRIPPSSPDLEPVLEVAFYSIAALALLALLALTAPVIMGLGTVTALVLLLMVGVDEPAT